MSRFEEFYNHSTHTPSRISIGTINRVTLNKPLKSLNKNEKEQLDYLKRQLKWSKRNGYNIVMTNNSYKQNSIDCWLLRNSSMPFLTPGFKKKILHVL